MSFEIGDTVRVRNTSHKNKTMFLFYIASSGNAYGNVSEKYFREYVGSIPGGVYLEHALIHSRTLLTERV